MTKPTSKSLQKSSQVVNYADLAWGSDYYNADRTATMQAVEAYHDTSTKKLLNNTVLPAGQTAQM